MLIGTSVVFPGGRSGRMTGRASPAIESTACAPLMDAGVSLRTSALRLMVSPGSAIAFSCSNESTLALVVCRTPTSTMRSPTPAPAHLLDTFATSSLQPERRRSVTITTSFDGNGAAVTASSACLNAAAHSLCASVGFSSRDQARQLIGILKMHVAHQGHVRRGGGEDRHAVLCADIANKLRRGLLGVIKSAAAVLLVGHAQRIIDDDDPRRATPRCQPPAHPRTRQHRPGHRQNQRDDHQRAKQQKQKLLDPQPPTIRLDRQLQILHRRPIHDLKPPPVQQVDDDRHAGEHEAEEDGAARKVMG